MTNDRLPVSSSYSIIDSITNETIIPFAEGNITYGNSRSKMSNDGDGSFFKLRMDNFMPERYYKICVKTIINGSVLILDDNYYFKVVNAL